MDSTTVALETFRDPAGSLRIEEDRVIRTVKAGFAPGFRTFLSSPLASQWMAERRMVPTVVLEEHKDGSLLLEHERIFFPSYPWEWTPGQWMAAATLTLDLCEELLPHGLILKDATPLNILFDGPNPILVDVLSIEEHAAESPVWLAYGQFVRTFLLPLYAYRELGWPLAATMLRRDGYEPDDLIQALNWRKRWLGVGRGLITLPHMLEKKKTTQARAHNWSQPPEVAQALLRRTLRNLRRMLGSVAPSEQESRWRDYTSTADHYAEQDHKQKQQFIAQALELMHPTAVLDLGANTGTYSRLAASTGARVVAWDIDVPAADINWREAQAKQLSIQPLVADAARPTPALGWANRETLRLLERAEGRFDCVMALGLLHHLLLAEQIPMAEIARLFASLTRRWAIVEWIPVGDVRFQELIRGRDELYGHLSEQDFLTSFSAHFAPTLREELGNGRVLFVLEKS